MEVLTEIARKANFVTKQLHSSSMYVRVLERRTMVDNDNEILLDYGSMTFEAKGGFVPVTNTEPEWVTPELGTIE